MKVAQPPDWRQNKKRLQKYLEPHRISLLGGLQRRSERAQRLLRCSGGCGSGRKAESLGLCQTEPTAGQVPLRGATHSGPTGPFDFSLIHSGTHIMSAHRPVRFCHWHDGTVDKFCRVVIIGTWRRWLQPVGRFRMGQLMQGEGAKSLHSSTWLRNTGSATTYKIMRPKQKEAALGCCSNVAIYYLYKE